MAKKVYTKEFKIQALELAKEMQSVSGAARELGIGDSLIHSWKKKYKFEVFNQSGKSAGEAIVDAEEVRRLQKENEELKKVNYILKRAAAFFSQDHLR